MMESSAEAFASLMFSGLRYAYGLPLVLEVDGKRVVRRGVFPVLEEPLDGGRAHGSR